MCHVHVGKRGGRFARMKKMIRGFRRAANKCATVTNWNHYYKKSHPESKSRAVVRSSSNAAVDNEETSRGMVILPTKVNTVKLPNEIFDAILGFFPHSSLYILRQTSRGFRQYIDSDPVFLKFQRISRWHRLAPEAVRDSRDISASLGRRALCKECRALSIEELRERLLSLCEPRRCSGCNKNHPGIFFFANG
jgi:hypothetical protein